MTKKAVLIVNLGSPDSPNIKDVRKYLDEFLMDERVIDIPYWKRFLLIKGIILNTRPKKSAHAYKKIWLDEGSPLIVFSERFKTKLEQKTDLPVVLAMRYGSMSIKNALEELNNQGVEEVFLIPLYPHFAMSSYETVVVKVQEVAENYYPGMKVDVFPPFYNNAKYIDVMSTIIEQNLEGFDYDHILFSYHGIPERHIKKSDPTGSHCQIDGQCCNTSSNAHAFCYRHQCFETTKAIAKQLNLEEGRYSNSFQSRLLKDPWLRPYTDATLEQFPTKGIKRIAVVTPSFVTDCLETLEEIVMEGQSLFMENGGEEFKHVPCMNDDDNWVDIVNDWINEWELTKKTD